MRGSLAETVMALTVLAAAGIFLTHALRATEVEQGDGITVMARFTDVGPLEVNAPVVIRGGRVGTVTALRLDPVTYFIMAEMTLIEGARLPVDSQVSIGRTSLLGGAAAVIEPGSDPVMLSNGGRLKKSRNARSIEDEFALEALGGGLDDG